MGGSTRNDSVFKNAFVLDDDYVPQEVVGRDKEQEELISALQSVARGSVPNNVFVYGSTGVGKTIVTRKVLQELQEDTDHLDHVDVEVVWQNCEELTGYQTAIELANHFKDEGEKLNNQGYSRSRIHRELWNGIESTSSTHTLFVLEKINHLGSDDGLLYQLSRARANGKIEDTQIGVIGITNDFTYREQLSAKVTSTLREREIRFGSYDANELRSILTHRAKVAFESGVLTDDVIPLASALAGQETGSARHALDILLQAGELASDFDDDQVTEDHLREGYERVERGKVLEELRDLPQQALLISKALLLLTKDNRAPARRKTIYDIYEYVAEDRHSDPKSPRTVHDCLQEMSLGGFVYVEETNDGMSGGRAYQYGFDVKAETIERALIETGIIEEDEESENATISRYT